MSALMKKWILSISLLLLTIIFVGIGVQFWVQQKINAYIAEDMPSSIYVKNHDVKFNLWKHQLTCRPLEVYYDADSTDNYTSKIAVENIDINGLKYYQLWKNDKIILDNLILSKPVITHHKSNNRSADSKTAGESKKAIDIYIDKFQLESAEVMILNNTQDSITLTINDFNLILRDIMVSDETLNNHLPFQYSDSYCSYDSLHLKVGNYEYLVSNFGQLKYGNFTINDFRYFTKHDRTSYNKLLSLERDHVDINIDNIKFTNFKLKNSKNRKLAFFADSVYLNSPVAKLYRDKSLEDNIRNRIFYGEKINRALIDMNFDNVLVVNGFLQHEIHKDLSREPGKLKFKNIYSTISNFSNVNQKQTYISFQTKFMEEAKVKGNWSFSTIDPKGTFQFTGAIDNLPLKDLDQLMIPNQNSRMTGFVNSVDFNIMGNLHNSSCDLTIDYQDLKLILLDEENKKRKIVSSLANIMIHDDGTIPDEKKDKISITIDRDPTTSFWKYIWQNIKTALAEDIIKL